MKKVCKNCKLFVDGVTCPTCKGNQFSTVWQGRISVIDADKSVLAEKLEMKQKGEYALKYR
ncbi:DNA-directed RNA polymerase subunit E'' [Candidatus Woesearchaeota archaeon]|nr:DNA-directed RNA polymerase subunit E'' [Candidatus Woesearchaeota archaeon]